MSPRLSWVWLDRVFFHNEARIWSLEAREPQMWRFSGSHSFIRFPGLQSLQASFNSSPSVLLPTPDLFYNSRFSLNPSYSPHRRWATLLLSCATKTKSQITKQQVSITTHSLPPTHTHTPSLFSISWNNYPNQDSWSIQNIWQIHGECCFDSDKFCVQSKRTGLRESEFEPEIHQFSPDVFWVQNRQAAYKGKYGISHLEVPFEYRILYVENIWRSPYGIFLFYTKEN